MKDKNLVQEIWFDEIITKEQFMKDNCAHNDGLEYEDFKTETYTKGEDISYSLPRLRCIKCNKLVYEG